MALVSKCDRCGVVASTEPMMLGDASHDLCAGCAGELREWLKPVQATVSPRGKRMGRALHARRYIARDGVCDARKMADDGGEPYRRVYFALLQVAGRGELVHLGKGRFVLPSTDVADGVLRQATRKAG